LRGGGEGDFDFLVADLDEHLEEAELLVAILDELATFIFLSVGGVKVP
jgi:hypothetical protein